MRFLRGALLVLTLLVPFAGATCCVPDEADACCNEETACPLSAVAAPAHATPAPTYTLERATADAPAVVPAAIECLASPLLFAAAAPAPDAASRGSTDPALRYPLRN